MELDFRKKSRRDKIMHSKSLDAADERDRSQGIGRIKRLSHLMDVTNRCLPDGRKGMQRPGKIENVLEKIHARARKIL